LYHILSRGNERRDLFFGADDYKVFLGVLEEMSERFEVDIFAYVLMSNHYHLLIRTNQANLSKSMQWVGTTYTRRFNLKHFRSGHLFQGRFKSILVQNDAYTNKQIGELFGLTYSAVSRRASIVKSEIFKQSEMRQKYSLIKSMIKV